MLGNRNKSVSLFEIPGQARNEVGGYRLTSRPTYRLQSHLVNIRVALLEAEGYVEGIGFFAPGAGGEVEIDRGEFGAGEVDDALEEGAADALAAIG